MFKLLAITAILLLAVFAVLSVIQVLTKKPLSSGSCKNNSERLGTTCSCGQNESCSSPGTN